MGKAVLVILAAVIIIAGGVYLLRGSTKQTTQPTTPNTEITTSPTTSQSGTSSANQAENSITLTQSGFSPATLTIKVGQTVTWMNKSGETATVNSNPHPVHTDYPPLNLGQFANDSSLTLTFSKPGTYGYHNHLNPNETGTIIVQ